MKHDETRHGETWATKPGGATVQKRSTKRADSLGLIDAAPRPTDGKADYIAHLEDRLETLERSMQAWRNNRDAGTQDMGRLGGVAAEIALEGRRAGHQLMMEIGDSLAGFLGSRQILSPRGEKVIAAHIDALKGIGNPGSASDGSAIGNEIIAVLQVLVATEG